MANLNALKKFDLNLLVIFECIYQHLSIRKAAESLYITPSAVSQSLQRLRNQFNDPLFIRSGKGITPTTVGINLHYHLEKNLNHIEQTINIMNSSGLKKTFVIYGPQLLIGNGMTDLIACIREEPCVEIEYHDLLISPESAENLLAYRKADLILTIAPVSSSSVVCTHFKSQQVILACSQNHPRLGSRATIDEITREHFASFTTDEPGVKEMQTKNNIIPQRKTAFRSHSFISVLNIISCTDIIGFIPGCAFEKYKDSLALKQVIIPIELPILSHYLMYNRASMSNSIFAKVIARIPTASE